MSVLVSVCLPGFKMKIIYMSCLASWQTIIDACITKKSAALREIAISALAEMTLNYYVRYDKNVNTALVRRYMTDCDDTLEENIRMGCVSALGALPRHMLEPCLKDVLHMLIKQSLKLRTDQSQVTNTWAESRRDAVKAISRVVATFGFKDQQCAEILDEVFACFLKALLEYTIDDRGDIGAWVREAAMNGLFSFAIYN